ncbi:hypothetical protein OE88DRAFT_895376 [Heliocybe sulcata]|uniref:Uncharacterized protein n=1 Tax=Heliocybe sulcata TaxID=5364 RepID=A0A5C3MND8_9AGAM|nr:hypothetical protein OE88DRAFT_895376 [Heliocybe sulcata]
MSGNGTEKAPPPPTRLLPLLVPKFREILLPPPRSTLQLRYWRPVHIKHARTDLAILLAAVSTPCCAGLYGRQAIDISRHVSNSVWRLSWACRLPGVIAKSTLTTVCAAVHTLQSGNPSASASASASNLPPSISLRDLFATWTDEYGGGDPLPRAWSYGLRPSVHRNSLS